MRLDTLSAESLRSQKPHCLCTPCAICASCAPGVPTERGIARGCRTVQPELGVGQGDDVPELQGDRLGLLLVTLEPDRVHDDGRCAVLCGVQRRFEVLE